MEEAIKLALYGAGSTKEYAEKQCEELMKMYNKKISDMEETRLIRDRMIYRVRKALHIESQELKVIEKEIIEKCL